ncbi:MAG: IS21 family transposase [Planctomycetes bacterium]|nr:IS21 family transposase [Planctomycetota bacterium]
MTIRVLNERGESKCSIARTLGVTEGAVRYHLRRQASGAVDGRRKILQLEALGLADATEQWWEAQQAALPNDRPPNIESLHAWLQAEHGYDGSYKSVRKFVRRHFPAPKRRPFRRIETPPGAQSQTDWMEFRGIDVGDGAGPTTLYGFVMALSHSRQEAVVWSRSMDQLAWHRCHNEAFRRLGGVAAANRIDNLKTGISRGAGAWGEVNPQYRAYARALGFHVDACEVRAPEQKGKAERRVGVFKRIDPRRMCFDSMTHLQEWTDAKVEAMSARRICPATGRSVHETWLEERPCLGALPETLPEPFDVAVARPVHKDCTVRFEGRSYVVPFAYCGETVEVRGCAGIVQVVDRATGRLLVSYPRGTAARILIDDACYEGEATARVAKPKPLGRMARKLRKLAAMPVEIRPVDLYAELAEVAR